MTKILRETILLLGLLYLITILNAQKLYVNNLENPVVNVHYLNVNLDSNINKIVGTNFNENENYLLISTDAKNLDSLDFKEAFGILKYAKTMFQDSRRQLN